MDKLADRLLDLGLQDENTKKSKPHFGYLTGVYLLNCHPCFILKVNGIKIKVQNVYEDIGIHINPFPKKLLKDFGLDLASGRFCVFEKSQAERIFYDICPSVIEDVWKYLRDVIFKIRGFDRTIKITKIQVSCFLMCNKRTKIFPKEIAVIIAKDIWSLRFVMKRRLEEVVLKN